MRRFGTATFVDTHCHLDLMYNNMYSFDKYSAFREKNKSTYPPTYEGCIPDWCDPEVFDEGKGDWWINVMEVIAEEFL